MVESLLGWGLAALVGALLGGGIAVYSQLAFHTRRLREAHETALQEQRKAKALSGEAEKKQKEILLEARDEALRIKGNTESELRERRAELQRSERRLAQKEEHLERRVDAVERRERQLANRERDLENLRSQVEAAKSQQVQELERIAGMSREEAKAQLLRSLEEEVRQEGNRRLLSLEQEIKEQADERARKILATSVQRLASDVVSETTVTVVPIPSDDMKGRIIGREGRNIRALEAATGVDLIIDDTPDCVTLSAFDPVRREIARVALSKLILDGRIHPARIEEAVDRARQEVERTIQEEGERAFLEMGLVPLHPELVTLVGRGKYRYSYGQNLLKHSLEVAHFAGMVAAELGADVKLAKQGGLLHDIGKVVSHEVEGPHALIGGEILRRLAIPEVLVQAVEGHHGENGPVSLYAVIVSTADAISGGRAGARRESVEQYIKRLEALERIADSFEGVEKAFAIQAGREVRILVKPEQIDDMDSFRLARDIVKKIEETLVYPGQIKVTVIRETRAIEYAR